MTSVESPALEVMRRYVERFAEGDMAGACALIAPGAVWHQSGGLPWSGDWVGPDGFASMMGAIATPAELLLENLTFHDAGEFVVAKLDAVFVSRSTGARLRMPMVEHYAVRDGLIQGSDVFYKDPEAVRRHVTET